MMVCPAPLLIDTTGSTHFFTGTPEEEVQTIMNREEAASMATIISLAANLALLLAKKGKRVTLADLDVG
jgi:hypothetical protein